MRGKLIAVFSTVVLIVGVLSYALARVIASKDVGDQEDAPRALNAAMAELHVQGLSMERWLGAQALDPKLRDPFKAGTADARAEAATNEATRLADAATASSELGGVQPTVVLFVTAKGVVLGRNGSALMRGDDLGKVYPRLLEAMQAGKTGSDVWVNRTRNEQLLASYVPVRDEDGATWLGAIVVGTSLNDERLKNASDRTSGRFLIAVVPTGDALDVVAKSTGTPSALTEALVKSPAKERALSALNTGQMVDIDGLPDGYSAKTRPLEGYGERSALLVCATAQDQSELIRALLWPALGVTLLGLVLVVIASVILDAYLSRPISELEEGLLAIMNGKTDLRFEIEHAELGGLVFRINSLLNQLLGVQEDDTDEQGRPSRSPTAGSFEDALSVDERMATLSGSDVADAKELREEADGSYYGRIFQEYIVAKRSLGDPVDHITQEAFISRIMASERDMAAKHGKPVRYKVEVQGKEVMLLAVPLA